MKLGFLDDDGGYFYCITYSIAYTGIQRPALFTNLSDHPLNKWLTVIIIHFAGLSGVLSMLEVSVMPTFGCVLRHTSTGTSLLRRSTPEFVKDRRMRTVHFCSNAAERIAFAVQCLNHATFF